MWEIPLTLQDDVFFRDSNLDEKEALNLTLNVVKQVRDIGGVCVLNLHPRLMKEREDARMRSRAVSKGLMLENISPYLPTFKHHPRDARFLGDPIDFVIFDGLFPKGKIKKLTITEIKSGNSRMNEVEKSVKTAVEKGRVDFELIRVN